MEKTRNEQIEICVNAFRKCHKNEKLFGTLTFIAFIIASIFVFPLNTTLGVSFFCLLFYLKFIHDIKQKWNKAISEFKKHVEEDQLKSDQLS